MNIGEVWTVDFPFEDDATQSKIRPCLIMDVQDKVYVLSIKITRHKARDEYDIPIFKWEEANLLEPSFARVSKVMLFLKDCFIKKCGKLNDTDFNNIKRAFVKYYRR
ncbi:MAG: type II toxin-antitoxin system PemK/MazF family toxin [Clostridia bacterium]|nr:type II toxin-antitoxin system PemK/MazF family toxin [Clostridia bacterium]